MAKLVIPDESGEVVKGGKPGPVRRELSAPIKPQRGFPFRLWFWAIMMTAAAGAGGYFTYQFRDRALTCEAQSKGDADAQTAAVAKQKEADDTACGADKDTLSTQLTGVTSDRDTKAKSLTECNTAVDQLKDLQKGADAREQKYKEFLASFGEMTKAGDLKVVARHGSLVFVLPSEVLFPSASADLSKPGYVTLIQFAGILRDKFSDRRFMVVGHTDNLPLKSTQYKDNLELSTARGISVTRTLIEGGVKPENLLAAGAGDSDPVADNASADGRAQNRRIEITLLPALADLPALPKDVTDSGK